MKERKSRRIIIERWGMYAYGIMFPSGRVTEAQNRSQAERLAKQYLARGIKPNEKRVDFIEWRDRTQSE